MKKMLSRILPVLLFLFVSFTVVAQVNAEEKMLPFALGSNEAGKLSDKTAAVKSALEKNGFTIAGDYSPFAGVHIIVVTNEQLKKAGASHDRAGYIAAQRVSLTERDGKIQVSYTNPPYMAAAYQVKTDLTDVTGKLKSALGFERFYGPAEGKTVKQLNDYHYMFGMEYFDDYMTLAEHSSHDEAVKILEKNLAAGDTGAFKVYRIDIPGTEQVLVGVGMKLYSKGDIRGNKHMDETFIMSEIDFKEIRSSAHLPYEVLVRGDETEALHARFRIAINFTDLAMMGDHSFMNIMSTPGAIQELLTKVAGGEEEEI
jgi:hypothetical protein